MMSMNGGTEDQGVPLAEAMRDWRGRWYNQRHAPIQTFEEIQAELRKWDHELGNLCAVFGTWAVTADGIECLVAPYFVANDRPELQSADARDSFVAHICQKKWMRGYESDVEEAFDYWATQREVIAAMGRDGITIDDVRSGLREDSEDANQWPEVIE